MRCLEKLVILFFISVYSGFKGQSFVLEMVPMEDFEQAAAYEPYYQPNHKRAFSIEDFDPSTFDKIFKRSNRGHFRRMYKRNYHSPIFKRSPKVVYVKSINWMKNYLKNL